MKNTDEKMIEAFREKFEVRDYVSDAHTWDIHVYDKPEEIEQFLLEWSERIRKEERKEWVGKIFDLKIDVLNTVPSYDRVIYYQALDEVIRLIQGE